MRPRKATVATISPDEDRALFEDNRRLTASINRLRKQWRARRASIWQLVGELTALRQKHDDRLNEILGQRRAVALRRAAQRDGEALLHSLAGPLMEMLRRKEPRPGPRMTLDDMCRIVTWMLDVLGDLLPAAVYRQLREWWWVNCVFDPFPGDVD